MQAIAITYKGLEEASKKEIKEILGKEADTTESIALFSVDKELDLCTLTYRAQTMQRIGILLSQFTFTSVEDIEKKVKEVKFDIKGTFAVRCGHPYDEDIVSSEIEGIVGETINGKVDLDNPDETIYVFIKEKTFSSFQ